MAKDPVFDLLAAVCWIVPLIGLVWGPGAWWFYVLWLVVGTAILAWYDKRHPTADT